MDLTDKLHLYNTDNMEFMATIPDKYFELAIVDPPYFEAYKNKNYTGAKVTKKGIKRNQFESKNWEIPNQKYFDQLFRISKNQIIWGCNYYAKFIPNCGRLVWDKENDFSTFSKAEIASHSFGVSVEMFRYMWNGMLQGNMKDKEQKIHSCQKPVALYKWILSKYAKQGDKIFDSHLGSMSIAIACHDYGFDLTGCELDVDYYNQAIERVKRHIAQPVLFQAELPESESQLTLF